jgi:hypothetical protein
MNEEKVDALYRAASSKYADAGDFETFKIKIQNPEKRKALYDRMKSDGYSDLGNYYEFNSKLGFSPFQEEKPYAVQESTRINRAHVPQIDMAAPVFPKYNTPDDVLKQGEEQVAYDNLLKKAQKEYVEWMGSNGIDPLIKEAEGLQTEAEKEAFTKANRLLSMSGPHGSVARGITIASDKDVSLTNKSLKVLKEARRRFDASKGGNGFIKGITPSAEELKELVTFTEFINDYRLNKVIDKYEKDPESLTETENLVIKAKYVADLITGNVDPGIWYNVGATTKQSLPFMRDFIITGGVGGGASALVKKGASAFLKKAVGEKALKATPALLGKAGGAAVDLTVKPAVQTLLSPSSYAMSFQEMQGQATAGEDGKTKFEDRRDFSLVSPFIENQSEVLGEVVLEKLLKKLGIPSIKFLNNQFAGRVQKAAGIQGVTSEYLEEKYADLANIVRGEATMEEFFDPRRNLETFLAVGVMQVPFKAMQGTGYAIGKTGEYMDRRAINRAYQTASGNLNQTFGDSSGGIAEYIHKAVDNGTDEAVRRQLLNIAENPSVSDKQKRALIEYAMAYSAQSGMNKAQTEEKETAKREAGQAVMTYVNPKMNAVVTAVVAGYDNPVQLVDGDVKLDADGFIDREASDRTVVILNDSGKRVPVSIKYLEELEENIPVTEAVERAAQMAERPLVEAQENEAVREYETGETVRISPDGGNMFLTGRIAGREENGSYLMDIETPAGMQRMKVEPRQIVNEDSVRGIENGSVVEYRNEKGEVVQGTVDDAYGYRQEGRMVIDDVMVNVSDIIGPAPSEEARQEKASQQNPKYASLDEKALTQALSDIDSAIERNENPEQTERFIREREEIGAELERRKGAGADPVAAQGSNALPENETPGEATATEGQGNVAGNETQTGAAEESEEEKEKRLFYESLPKNKKGEMDESSMTDGQKLRHLEYRRGKEFTLNAARKSRQNTEKEIKKLRDRFDRESDPMKLDRIQDQIDFLSERAKTYEGYIAAAQMEKLRENIDHNRQMQATEDKEAREREESKRMAAEQAEMEALENERIMGVPDASRDKAVDARRRGYRLSEGARIDRQPKMSSIKGVPVSRKFSETESPEVIRTVVDANILQPSHKNGIRNNRYFITEAQPKERTDDVSRISSENIAKNINPQEITGGITAYTGSPVINAHGEVIQGNNRTVALQQMYEQFPEEAEKYRQYLSEHASDYGMTAEQVMSMERPVAVDVMDVPDEQAIRLGQLGASDTESGGIQRIQPVQASRQLGDNAGRFAEILFENKTGEDLSIGELLNNNANRALDYLLSRGVINNTQYQSAFDRKGNLTPEAKADLAGISTQILFAGANDTLPQRFDMLPAKAKTAILQTIHRDGKSDPDSKIIDDIRMGIEAYSMLSQDADFAKAKTEEDIRRAARAWSNQMHMDFSEGNFIPSERFNNFAIELAILFKSQSLTFQRQLFNALYDNLQGVGGNLFNPAERLGKIESIRKYYNIEYNGNELQGSHALAHDSRDGTAGEQRSANETAGREQAAQREQSPDGGGRTEPDNGQRKQPVAETAGSTPLTGQQAAQLVELMEESATDAPQLELTPENWEAEFGEDGRVETPVGQVKMGDNQYRKIIKNGRQREFGMIKPTLTNPDVIIEVQSEAKEGQTTERPSSLLFVKTFNVNGEKVKFFTSVTVSKDGLEVVISNHIIEPKQINSALTAGRLQYQRPDMALRTSVSSSTLLRQPAEANDSAGTSTGKNNTENSDSQRESEENETEFNSGEREVQGSKGRRVESLVQNRPEIEYDSKRWNEASNGVESISGKSGIISFAGRKIVVVDVDGFRIPFYLSTGHGGKANVTSGKWYPFFGISEDGWLNKLGENEINGYYGSDILREISEELDRQIGDIRNDATIPEVGVRGRHIDAINQSLSPTENGHADTVKDITANIERVKKHLNSTFGQDAASSLSGQVVAEERLAEAGGDIIRLAQNETKRNEIAQAEKQVNTHPSEAQKEAGNYRKGHVRIQGFDVSIENPKGSVRSGTDKNGKKWEQTMNHTYGYILGTESKDKDHIDVFIGDNSASEKVFVVDQVNPETGEFDEHKVMMGFNDITEAEQAYLSNYEKGWKGLGSITETGIEDFRKWAEMEGRRIKPFGEYKSVQGNNVRLQAKQAEDLEAVNERFNGELDSLTPENADSKVFNLGNPSLILQTAGIRNKSFKLYGNKIIKKARKHGFKFTDIKNLPQAINNPIAVFAGNKTGSHAILTELQIDGKNVLVSVDLGKGEDIDFNIVTSTYGKNSKGIVDWIINGKLLYSDKEKTLNYLHLSAPIAEASNNSELDSATKIVQEFENPKLPGEKMQSSRSSFKPVSRKKFDKLIERLKKTWLAKEIVTDSRKMREALEKALGKKGAERFMTLWHGSPHSFDQFMMDYIGTGEGHQNFGWGLYFTDKKEIANHYKDKLSYYGSGYKSLNEDEDVVRVLGDIIESSKTYLRLHPDFENIRHIRSILGKMLDVEIIKRREKENEIEKSIPKSKKEKSIIRAIDISDKLPKGYLYEAKIHGELNFIRWDKPLTEKQYKQIAEQAAKEGKDDYSIAYRDNNGNLVLNIGGDTTGEWFYKKELSRILGGDRYASEFLLRAGINGIQYPTEILVKGSHEDSYNYVVFDENAIEIVKIRLMSTPKGEVYGFVSPDGTVYLDPDRMNANTPIHEFGHLWNDFIKQNNPELWERGKKLIKNSPYWEKVNGNPAYAGLSEEEKTDEALAMAIGDRGEAMVQSGDILGTSRIRTWLNELWNFIRESLFRMIPNKVGIENMSLDDFTGLAVKELTAGKKLTPSAGQESGEQGGKRLDKVEEATTRLEHSDTNSSFVENNLANHETSISDRNAQEEQRGGDEIHSRIEEVSNELRSGTGANDSKLSRTEREDAEKRIAFDYARKKGLWIDDLYSFGKPLQGGGNENTLAYNDENGAIYKSNNLFNSKGLISNLLETVKIHNLLFPNTQYELVGFTGMINGANHTPYVEVILKQDYVPDAEQASPQEISDYMQSIGFRQVNEHTFTNGEYTVSDLRPRNVLKDKNGTIYVVDNIVSSNRSGDTKQTGDDESGDIRLQETGEQRENETSEARRIAANAVMPRSAKTVSEAQELIRPLVGKPITNSKLGITATISGNSLGKLGSQSATDKSVSPALHAKAIANIDVLFQNAEFDVTHKDEKNRDGIEQIHRLGSLMFDEARGEYVPVMITVKEFNNNRGNRIYTVEAVDIEKTKSAGLMVGNNQNESWQTPIADFNAKIQRLIETAKQSSGNGGIRFQVAPASGNTSAGEQDFEYSQEERARLEKRLKRVWFRIGRWNVPTGKAFREGIQDALLPVREWMDFLRRTGMKISDADDFYMNYTSMSGKIDARMEHFKNAYVDPLNKAIARLMKKTGSDSRTVGLYAMLKHIPERTAYLRKQKENEFLAKKPEATQAEIDAMLKRLPDNGLRAIVRELHHMKAEEELSLEDAELLADAFIKEFEDKAGEEDIKEFRKRIKRATEFSLDERYKAGLISLEKTREIKEMFEHYIPLRGHDADTAEDTFEYGMERGEFFVKANKRAEGRSSIADDPFSYLYSMGISAIHESVNNHHLQQVKRLAARLEKAAKAEGKKPPVTVSRTWLVKAGEKNGHPEWKVADEIPYPPDDKNMTEEQRAEKYREAVEAEDKRLEELAEKGEAMRSGTKRLDLGGMFIKPSSQRQHDVHVWVNGVMYTVRFHGNPSVARAINKANRIYADREQNFLSGMVKAMGVGTRFLSVMYTTFRPAFALFTNPVRDFRMIGRNLYVKEGAAYAVRAYGHYLAALPFTAAYMMGFTNPNNKYSRYYSEYIINGAKTGISRLIELRDIQKEIGKDLNLLNSNGFNKSRRLAGRFILSAFTALNEWTENNARFAAYVTSREMGRSVQRSVSDAKEVTVNFNRKGSGAYGGAEMRAMYAFVNVGFQGLQQYVHNWKAHTGRMIAVTAADVAISMFLIPALNDFLAGIFGGDDDDEVTWKDKFAALPDFVRNNSTSIWTGKGFIHIPLPQEYRAHNMIGTGLFMLREGRSDAKKVSEDVMIALLELIAYNPVLDVSQGSLADAYATFLVPTMQAHENKTFTGSPIYNEYADPDKPLWEQVRTNKKGESYAPKSLIDFFRLLDEATGGDGTEPGWANFDPDKWNHILNGYVGAIYKPLIQAIDVVRGDMKFQKMLVPKAMYTPVENLPLIDPYSAERYFDARKETERALKYYKSYATKYLEASPENGNTTLGDYMAAKYPELTEKAKLDAYPKAIRKQEGLLKGATPDEQKGLEMEIAELKYEFLEKYNEALSGLKGK